MPTERKHAKSARRTIIDWDTFDQHKDDYALVCVSRGVLDIARLLISKRGMWATTYAAAVTDSGYTPIDDIQLNIVKEYISEFLEETTMNCEELLTKLDDIVTAISTVGAGGGCGCGSGGAGESEEPASTEEVDPPGTPGGNYPPGFASQGEYETYKCNVATWIVDSLSDDIGMWQTIDVVSMTLIIFGSLLILPVPGARIAALLVAVVSLLGLGASAAQAFKDAVDNNRDALICTLYNQENATDALDNFTTELKGCVDSETADPVFRFAIKAVIDLIIGYEAINKLFVKDEFTQFPTGDCALCQCPNFEVQIGTGLVVFDEETTIQAVDTEEFCQWRIRIEWNSDCGPCEDHNIIISSTSGAIGGVACGLIKNCADVDVWRWNVQGYGNLIGTWCGRVMDVSGTGPFSVTLTVEGATC